MEAQLNALADELSDAFGRDVDTVRARLDAAREEARRSGLPDREIERLLEHWRALFGRRRPQWLTVETALADLRALLAGPQTNSARTWNWLRRVSAWAFDHYVAVAGLVTLIATAFYGLAYAWFYEALDVTVDQAGLGPPQILTRSVLGGLTLVVLFSLSTFACFLWLIPFRDDPAASREKGSWSLFVANLLLAALALGMLLWFGYLLVPNLFFVLAAFVAVLFIPTSLRFKRIEGRWSLHPRPLRFNPDKYLTFFVALALPTGLAFTCATTLLAATFYGERASAGHSVRDPKILGMPFLGVRAEPALISWTTAEPPQAGIPHCLIYLGSNGGDAVFYDHRARSAVHVPSGEVIVELRSQMSDCDEPVNVRVPYLSKVGPEEFSCHPGRWQGKHYPDFHFEWISEGIQIETRSRWPRRFREESAWPLHRVYCQVTAESLSGHSTAVSKAAWMSIPQ